MRVGRTRRAHSDLDAALAINPLVPALQNKSHVLEQADRTSEAIRAID